MEDEKGDDLIPNQTNKHTHIFTLVVTRQQMTHFTLKIELTRLPNQFFFFSIRSTTTGHVFSNQRKLKIAWYIKIHSLRFETVTTLLRTRYFFFNLKPKRKKQCPSRLGQNNEQNIGKNDKSSPWHPTPSHHGPIVLDIGL